MDVASIALALPPLLGIAIQACKSAHKKFKIFRHYSREIARLRKHFERQQHFFVNECYLLLRSAIDNEAIIEAMLDDAEHSRWQGKWLESRLRQGLAKNYLVCHDIVEDIRAAMEELQSEFCCFDELASRRRKGEPLKDTVRRLRSAVNVAWNRAKFESCIKALGDSNNDLTRLREQANELHRPSTVGSSVVRKPVARECAEFRSIRKASSALHEALSSAWSRFVSMEGTHHSVKLFLDARLEQGVYMDVVVMCHGHDLSERNAMSLRTMWLLVRSQSLNSIGHALTTVSSAAQPTCDGSEKPHAKRRRVCFVGDRSFLGNEEASEPASTTSHGNEILGSEPDAASDDLLRAENICSRLSCHGSRTASGCATDCIGYIDTFSNDSYRHSFYRRFDASCNADTPKTNSAWNPVSMDEVLRWPVEKSLSIVDQLKLARSLVSAVLKFHSTPWLNEYFSLHDVSFFRRGQEVPDILETLHLGLEFSHHSPLQPGSPMKEVDSMCGDKSSALLLAALENAKLQYGVRNLTLWSLGTMLLQVGRWSKLDAPDDVSSVRKLASETCALGPRYQELTKKCLGCDFGYGDDLSKPRLQQAIHEKLVCELTDMISSLDICCDEEIGYPSELSDGGNG